MPTKTVLVAVVFASLGLISTRAQETAQNTPDEQVIRKSADDYCDAFNNGDVDALVAYWDNEADYIDEDGDTHRGKEAIAALFKNAAENLTGHRLTLKIDSLRFVKPEVAIEDGTATLTDPEDEATSSHYTAVWVKSGDKWLINSVRELAADEEDETTSESNADYLQPLAWLVGDWVSEDNGSTVNLTTKWALDKNFLVQEYTVAGEGGENSDLRVVQWLGFDPLTGQIKSWTFDSRGGYGEGLWSRDGNTWRAEATGVLPDGRTGSALNSVLFVDDRHLEWTSTGRNVEGQPMPDVEVKFVRNDTAEISDAP